MDILSLSSIILSVLGSLIGVLVKYLSKKKIENRKTAQEIPSSEEIETLEKPSELASSPIKQDYHLGVLTSNEGLNVLYQRYQQQHSQKKNKINKKKPSFTTGQKVLITFSIVILVFGLLTIIIYWRSITSDIESILFFIWLFLLMATGMFIQVITSNYRNGKALFDVSSSQLIFPLLFSIIVFYPIWSLAASAPHNAFSFYAAFLNGFFWETVVSSAKLPITEDR